MDLITTPVSNIEIDLHSSYQWDVEYHRDLYDLEKRKDSLTKEEKKLYSYLVYSQTNWVLKRMRGE